MPNDQPDQPDQPARPGPLQLFRRSIQFARSYRFAVPGAVLLALVGAVLGAADPLVMKYLFDSLSGTDVRHVLPIAVGALLGLEVGRSTISACVNVLSWDVRIGVDYNIRERVIAKLHALPMSYHQEAGVGGTMNKVNQCIAGYVAAFGELVFTVLPTLLYLTLSIAAMLRMEQRLALLVIIFTPLPAVIGVWAAKEQTQRERALLERWTRMYSRFNEVLAGIRTVKMFGMEEAERARFLGSQREGNEMVRRGARTDARTGAARGFAATLARLAAISAGSVLVVRGQITVGTLVAFLGYVSGLFGPVQGLTNTYQTIRRATVALENIFGILDADEVVGDAPDARPARRVRGDIRFHNVSFAYEGNTLVLRGVNVHVRSGETLALVGPNGSGKSTLTTLLQRLYPLSTGSIAVDGEDIRSMTQQSLRGQIAVVSQDIHLFNDTVRANIAYGKPDASDAEIEAAAEHAHAHGFILALPEGYDTVLGERGSRLSGGQRQRIAIARALLKDAPILILDEATSALDAVSEAIVQETIDVLRRGRTTMVIAHRLSTVVEADRILVLKGGEAVALGSHDELMSANGYYASLVRAQSDGLLLTQAA